MVLDYVLFAAGIPLLWKGADLLVEGAVQLARRWRVSPLVIGLTVVSFGTSGPELVVNVVAALRGNTELALGNVVGSNIANTLLILGVAAAIHALPVQRSTLRAEIPISLGAGLVVILLAIDRPFDGAGLVSRLDGGLLVVMFGAFLWYLLRLARATRPEPEPGAVRMRARKASLLVAVGLTWLIVGGDWLVRGAVRLAADLGIGETFVGLFIVAVGTSLPELATTLMGALRGETDLVVGNIVGSNVFNLLWVLGIAALVRPLPVPPPLFADIALLVGTSALLLGLARGGQRFTRPHGFVLVSLYAVYLALSVLRL